MKRPQRTRDDRADSCWDARERLAAASTYFSLMTGGRYQRLVADHVEDKPVLRAEQSDGVRKDVNAMSDGTADQIDLARATLGEQALAVHNL